MTVAALTYANAFTAEARRARGEGKKVVGAPRDTEGGLC